MEKVDTSVRSEQEGIPMTDTTSNTSAVLDMPEQGFAGLETREAHAWFGNHHALSGVSLRFPAKSVTGLIGLLVAASPPTCACSIACTNSFQAPQWLAKC
jgi:hypothetical protein